MSYTVENLPRAGTPMLFSHNGGKYHRVVIDTGIVMSNCGMRWLMRGFYQDHFGAKFTDPNKDTFDWPVTPYQGQAQRCEKCR